MSQEESPDFEVPGSESRLRKTKCGLSVLHPQSVDLQSCCQRSSGMSLT